MGLRESIQIIHPVDIDRFLDFLITEKGAEEHHQQPGAYLVDSLPFYKPQNAEGYVFILGFNMLPLSSVLIQALAERSDFAPGNTRILWILEQDILLDTPLDDFIE